MIEYDISYNIHFIPLFFIKMVEELSKRQGQINNKRNLCLRCIFNVKDCNESVKLTTNRNFQL